ncbi:hypothetical protein [Rhodococcus sp. IEGM 1379]|uniref:hypothetical protein n=1 Tax=Rhodococcus sp. IEGM 1379 TaxID=3047086 RepID=UPI0024B76155|nr:hypothetical protein [Rhodococcus sp. IEGM 1379]MDI9914044.1 hypothetical protein [Rhodococcus sp. IEGM 1379]
MHSRGFKRVLGGVAISSAAAIGLTFAGTTSALAAPLAPPLEVSVADNDITFTLTNPNPRFSFINCTPVVVAVGKLPGIINDPASILTPGVLEYPLVESPLDLFGVLPQRSLTETVTVSPGIYGVVGACVSIPELTAGLISGNIPIPTISLPEVVLVGSPLGSLGSSGSVGSSDGGAGSLSGSLEGLGFETLNDVIAEVLRIQAGIQAGSSELGSSNSGSLGSLTGSLTGSLSNGSSSTGSAGS